MAVIGWKLHPADRERLLARFVPAWPQVLADHVTLDAKASRLTRLPDRVEARVVGAIDDGEGLQALVISIDGTTDRPDGGTFHITWSLDRAKGRKAVHSNDVIAELGWHRLARPEPLRPMPARWD